MTECRAEPVTDGTDQSAVEDENGWMGKVKSVLSRMFQNRPSREELRHRNILKSMDVVICRHHHQRLCLVHTSRMF